MINVTAFHGVLQSMFEAFILSSMLALPFFQLAIQQFLQEAVIQHVTYMACPSKLRALEHRVNTHCLGSLEHHSILYFILVLI